MSAAVSSECIDNSSCRLRVGSATSLHGTPPHHQMKAPPPGSGIQRPNKPCCFCWCCCCSCSCLAVKGSQDSSSKGKDSNNLDSFNCDGEPPPTLEEIRCWGKSFDKLMRSSAGRKVFRDFLRCEYSEENILFWLACEELKKESNPDVVEEKARFIYEDYISILSPKEVSLDSRVREIVNKNMVAPTPHTFDEAQLQIYTLMHRDSYPRFINSALFKQLAQLGNNNGDGGASAGASGTATPTTAAQRKQSNA
ncbi:regulator of G-protein signaling 20 isoform X2 [Homalodisca vitripennis]|uniref:regulator of G-protein signaling 20 isoform X2 n=1 Tax=Homalodisca vitripennis TaxID=197043 RepID=UPI001EEADED8|nr:regulator of G-protein signaling 20 isoform X2 [Homalodisca vitripennis]